jgi:hypothetical protein
MGRPTIHGEQPKGAKHRGAQHPKEERIRLAGATAQDTSPEQARRQSEADSQDTPDPSDLGLTADGRGTTEAGDCSGKIGGGHVSRAATHPIVADMEEWSGVR